MFVTLELRIYVKIWVCYHTFIIPVAERQTQLDPWALLASSLTGKLQASERLLSQQKMLNEPHWRDDT